MIKPAILKADDDYLAVQLNDRPEAANQTIPFGPAGKNRVHPLHFVCDAVFEGKLSETAALQLAKTLVEHGADVNGRGADATTKDTPLIAACSLYCDDIALYLIDRGADLEHRGTHGGTCLHWAAWTGADRVVEQLLVPKSLSLDDQQDEFQSTPLLWAVNGWLHPKERNHRNQPRVMELLLEAGADPNLVDGDGRRAMDILLKNKLSGLVELLTKYGGKSS